MKGVPMNPFSLLYLVQITLSAVVLRKVWTWALGALSSLGQDNGAALQAAYGGDNPYAGAMVKLNDVNPTNAQIMANLGALGQVAGAAAAGTTTLSALVVSKAIAAIDTVAGFASSDGANTGPSPVAARAVRAACVGHG